MNGKELVGNAGYLERISLEQERILPLAAADGTAPYFSMILIYKGAENWVADLPVEKRGECRCDAATDPLTDARAGSLR